MSELKKVRANGSKLSRDGDANGEIRIENLLDHECDMLTAMINGLCRVECIEGRLVRRDLYEELPAPGEDPLIAPHWKSTGEPKLVQVTVPDADRGNTFPSISIQSVCGYYWTPEKYAEAVETLGKWGFRCLRSRRESDGTYLEIWYLPGLWLAKGELKRQIQIFGGKKESDCSITKWDREKIGELGRWIYRHVPFGTMDCIDQRLAMRAPE